MNSPSLAPQILYNDPPFRVVLVEPEIPQNTGSVARLCAATRCHLILVGKLGFDLSDAAVKRAGLDYWPLVSWEHQPDLDAFVEGLDPAACLLFSARSGRSFTHMAPRRGDYLFFGRETKGLPKGFLQSHPDQCYTLPIREPGVRSINLAQAAAVALYHGLWKTGEI
ncbi:MAG: tRNA (cytidine(34)-2'-O)-methyltransferase [Deltaproteobacteria bacterium]|nr:tRNA (cytidine(34)-2'-O)-methyltransferase [Deltaproteobacteria bacterium]